MPRENALKNQTVRLGLVKGALQYPHLHYCIKRMTAKPLESVLFFPPIKETMGDAGAQGQSLALYSVDHRPASRLHRIGASQEEEGEWVRKKEAIERGREGERCVGGRSAVM